MMVPGDLRTSAATVEGMVGGTLIIDAGAVSHVSATI